MNLVADFLWNFLSVVYFFCPRHAACGILVPRPGIKPGPMAVKALSPNPWTTREFPHFVFKLLMTTQGYTNKQGEKILLVGINNLLFSYLAFMYLEHSFLSEGNPKSCLSQQWYSGILLSFLPCPLLSFVKGWSVDQQHQVSYMTVQGSHECKGRNCHFFLRLRLETEIMSLLSHSIS